MIQVDHFISGRARWRPFSDISRIRWVCVCVHWMCSSGSCVFICFVCRMCLYAFFVPRLLHTHIHTHISHKHVVARTNLIDGQRNPGTMMPAAQNVNDTKSSGTHWATQTEVKSHNVADTYTHLECCYFCLRLSLCFFSLFICSLRVWIINEHASCDDAIFIGVFIGQPKWDVKVR